MQPHHHRINHTPMDYFNNCKFRKYESVNLKKELQGCGTYATWIRIQVSSIFW